MFKQKFVEVSSLLHEGRIVSSVDISWCSFTSVYQKLSLYLEMVLFIDILRKGFVH